MQSIRRHPGKAPLLAPAWALLIGCLACQAGGDIQPGIGAAGIRLGDDRAAVEKLLGRPDQVTSMGSLGDDRKETAYLIYAARGIDVLLEAGKVRSIFLYNEGADEHKLYPGRTPQGLTLHSQRDEVLSTLGDPSLRGLGDNADLWFRYDSGIEFSFQGDGTLHHLVVTHPH